MSLMIKGMDMPTKDSGAFCRLYRYKDGTAQFTQYGRTSFDQPDNHYFRAVEISTNHGRLIDADRLIAVLKSTTAISQSDYDLFNHIVGLIEHQPTVIEAEE